MAFFVTRIMIYCYCTIKAIPGTGTTLRSYSQPPFAARAMFKTSRQGVWICRKFLLSDFTFVSVFGRSLVESVIIPGQGRELWESEMKSTFFSNKISAVTCSFPVLLFLPFPRAIAEP